MPPSTGWNVSSVSAASLSSKARTGPWRTRNSRQGMIMLGSASNTNPYAGQMAQPQELDGKVTSPVYVALPDCNPVYARVKAEGAEILGELKTMDYGGAAFSVRDPEGYLWSVGEYDPWATEASKGA